MIPKAAGRVRATLLVNGRGRTIEVDPDRSLLSVLREELGLTAAKYGCGEAQCGACTVLAAGRPIRSCITPAASVVGKAISTLEGLARGDRLHPIQETFLQEDAMQCGYCTAGMLLSAAALLGRTPNPTEAQIRQAMHGNICRCGCYPRIVAAIRAAARKGKAT